MTGTPDIAGRDYARTVNRYIDGPVPVGGVTYVVIVTDDGAVTVAEREGEVVRRFPGDGATARNVRGLLLAVSAEAINADEHSAHTRTETAEGPDYCRECSEAAQVWVRWPCPTAENDARECPRCGAMRRKYHACPECGWLPASMGQTRDIPPGKHD